jgi:hypothetical protein
VLSTEDSGHRASDSPEVTKDARREMQIASKVWIQEAATKRASPESLHEKLFLAELVGSRRNTQIVPMI